MEMARKLSLLLCQQQATFGTAETDIVAADVMETIGPATVDLDPGTTDIDLVAGGFSQDAAIPGLYSLGLNFSVYARAAAADDVGQFGKCLLWSGMTVSEGTDGIFTYTPTSTQSSFTDFTAWLYSGSLASTGSNITKGSNGIISPKFTFEAGKPTIMACQAKLRWAGVSVVGTQPAITKLYTLPSALVGASTLTINGDTDYKLLSAEIDMGQVTSLLKDPKQTYGHNNATITDRKIKWTAKVYKDIPATVDPETALLNKTIGAFTIEYGTVPQKVSFNSTYSQITGIKHDEEDGVECWTLEGLFERNHFTVVVSTK